MSMGPRTLSEIPTSFAFGLTVAAFSIACGSGAPGAGVKESAPDASLPSTETQGDGAAGGADAALDGSVPSDASSDAPSNETWKVPTDPPDCDPTKPFQPAVPVSGGPKPTSSIAFSPDERIAIFPNGDLPSAPKGMLYAVRASRTSAFGAVSLLPNLANTFASYANISVSEDGLTLVTDVDASEAGGEDLRCATRASTQSGFAPFRGFYSFTQTDRAVTPFLRADGQELLFAGKASGVRQIYRASFGPNCSIGTPIVESALSAPADGEGSADAGRPVLTRDGLDVYFTRFIKPGGVGVWTAHRSSTATSFGVPHIVTEVSQGKSEIPQWVSPDGCRLYFRMAAGPSDIMVATRAK